MLVTRKALNELTAGDLMTPVPVTIPETMTLRGAAHLLAHAHVSGAPVVDSEGCCVGVLSTSDLLRWLDETGVGVQIKEKSMICEWSMNTLEDLPEDCVRNYMTTNLVTVLSEDKIGHLAELMTNTGIHRVIVVDEEFHALGVVSTADIVAALAGSRGPHYDLK